jgi:hypothetical protein
MWSFGSLATTGDFRSDSRHLAYRLRGHGLDTKRRNFRKYSLFCASTQANIRILFSANFTDMWWRGWLKRRLHCSGWASLGNNDLAQTYSWDRIVDDTLSCVGKLDWLASLNQHEQVTRSIRFTSQILQPSTLTECMSGFRSMNLRDMFVCH